MPGLVGATRTVARADGLETTIGQMAAAIRHRPYHRLDPIAGTADVAGTKVHLDILQRQHHAQEPQAMQVWLDGELYNAAQVAAAFGLPSACEADVVAAAAVDSTGELLRAIDGAFAAVVFSPQEGRLRFVTDRFGLRKLYLWQPPEGLAWSSETKAFLVFPGFRPVLDAAALEAFLKWGHLLGDATWFRGISLTKPATVVTYDMATGARAETTYWRWPAPRVAADVDYESSVRTAGELLRRAVERRCEGRIGLSLSGGLDSRALLAATPVAKDPIHVTTVGQRGCLDIDIARQVAERRGAVHHVFSLDEENWFAPRPEGVWLSDGHLNMLHMHGLESSEGRRSLFEINLNGFLGDALIGGSYLGDPDFSFEQKYLNRGRRFINEARQLAHVFIESRAPFLDSRLMDHVLRMPPEWLRGSRFYHHVLLTTFPDYFEHIPWQKTGLPITAPRWKVRASRAYRKIRREAYGAVARWDARDPAPWDYVDYRAWFREGRMWAHLKEMLLDKDSYSVRLVPGRAEKAMEAHARGRDRSEALARLLTVETWMRQVKERSGKEWVM